MTELDEGLTRLKSTAIVDGSGDGISGYVSVTKASLQIGGHRLWFDLERDGLRQVYLAKIC